MRPSRLNTIVDGVFAIAMTLLLLFLLFIAVVPWPTALAAEFA